ncbi:uncharacterized protein LOC115421951 isoform X2 [Sphaeramia orbicularis]|uniref:uncharacterized protein LOC115421951 isoform X2 n=1 Tax=Sphaeramia orbicularis TaxID=375764 RepID=UPI0011811FE5|nr:uncharacterized protein LOC115421951 isoform X2 [Sphaeramia orbicularis]XP_029993825.1 uncharacterized protein LOC115421951 isoform X2 [Sphaeramia orbicularis]
MLFESSSGGRAASGSAGRNLNENYQRKQTKVMTESLNSHISKGDWVRCFHVVDDFIDEHPPVVAELNYAQLLRNAETETSAGRQDIPLQRQDEEERQESAENQEKKKKDEEERLKSAENQESSKTQDGKDAETPM